jgi:hypothetical protein
VSSRAQARTSICSVCHTSRHLLTPTSLARSFAVFAARD